MLVEDVSTELDVQALDELERHALLNGEREDAAGARAADQVEELVNPLAAAPLELLEHLQREEATEPAAVER